MIFQIDLNNETMPMPLRVSRSNRKIKYPILIFYKISKPLFCIQAVYCSHKGSQCCIIEL